MRSFFIFLLITGSLASKGQVEGKWLRAFPITDYMVDLDDSTKVVQLEMPEGLVIPDRQLALAYGAYKTSAQDVVLKGTGRCQLVKSVYHYFAIHYNNSVAPLAKGDLLYMFLDTTDIYYGRIPRLASHFIRLQDIYEKPFYDRYLIFSKWTVDDEQRLLDSLVSDIRFTGQWMKEKNGAQDVQIEGGMYAGRSIFAVMIDCGEGDLLAFLDFLLDNPRNYAGGTWKITEIFATWLSRNP